MSEKSTPDYNLCISVGGKLFVTVGAGWKGRKEGHVAIRLNPCVVLDWKTVNAEDASLFLFPNNGYRRPEPARTSNENGAPAEDPATSRSAMAQLQKHINYIRRKHHGGAPPDDEDIPF